MKKGLSKFIFVVDRSGSMESVASDIIGGFNQFIKNQKENKIGECRVSFYQFDDVFEEVYKNVLIEDVKDLTKETFVPRNCTALYDAVGKTVDDVGKELSDLPENERPEKVWIVILTDGLENASVNYNQQKVREMIKHQQEKYNWLFTYIGANQDSWEVGVSIGVPGANTYNYVSTGANTGTSNKEMWDTLSKKASYCRSVDSSVTAAAVVSFTDEENEIQRSLIMNNK
jgi:hypothetical protein